MDNKISAIILTYNEELNLEKCLKSIIGLVGGIFIVDSFSTDRTIEIAKEYGVEVIQHKFVNQADQFNWALDNLNINSEWILRLDADEYLTDELKKEILEKLPETKDDTTGFFMKRRVYFMNKWIRFGGYYPTYLLRLFRYKVGRYENREMDEHIILSSGKIENLENDFIDHNQKGLDFWIEKHKSFAKREALAILSDQGVDNLGGQAGRKRRMKNNLYLKLPKFLRAFLYFIYRYIFRFGFLDGLNGLVFHFLQGFWYRFMVDINLYKLESKKS